MATLQVMHRQQEAVVDDILASVQRLAGASREMQAELKQQEEALDVLGEKVTTLHGRIEAARRRVDKLVEKAGSNRMLACVATLVCALIVLVLLIFLLP